MRTQTALLLVGLLSSPVKSFSSTSRRAFLATSSSTTMTPSEDPSGQGKVWDRFANGYSKQKITDEAAYQKKLALTQQYFKPNMNVVEIGCGTGSTSITHAPHVKQIIATDISGKMLEIAKQNAKEAGVSNVEFRKSSVEQLELPDGSQDVVLGLSILHLLEDKDAAIAKTRRLLKPDGLFVSSTVCIGDMGAATRFLMKTLMPVGQFFGLLPNVIPFTKKDLKESLTNGGFRIEHEWQPKQDAAVFIVGRKV